MSRSLRKIDLPPLNKQWLSNLLPAFVSAIIITITSTAAISMIFKGSLSHYLPIGISCALIGAVIVNFLSKFVCVFPFAVSCMTPNGAVVMGLFLAELGALGLSPEQRFSTIFAAFLLTFLLTAVTLFLVGYFKIGKIIRYMPYPVVCGFFAGVGWYLFMGASTIVGVKIGFSKELVGFTNFAPLLPCVSFALIAFSLNKFMKNPFVYIGFIVLSVCVFFLSMIFNGLNFNDITASELTVESPEIDFLVLHMSGDIFRHIHWGEIFSRWGYMLSFSAVNLLSLLAYAVNFEETSNTSVDLDREVCVMGLSNMAATLFTGGTTIFTTQSLTHRATGANHSISILYVSVFCLIILFFSSAIIPLIPKFIVSGILITNGLILIDKWLIKLYRRMSWIEWSMVAIIFFVMIAQGFIQGVAIGLGLAFMWVIVSNSRLDFIRLELRGPEVSSNTTYSAPIMAYLSRNRHKIYFLKLQGYFFFGSAERLFSHIRHMVIQQEGPPIEYLIVDFNFVSDLDATAIHSLIKLESFLQDRGCALILTGLNKKSRKHLGMAAYARKNLEFIPYLKSMELLTKSGKIMVFEDADAGIEWAERTLIKAKSLEEENILNSPGLVDFLRSLRTKKKQELFLSYLKKISLERGEKLITPAHPDHSMYFIESGHVADLLKKKRKGYKRLREFGPGQLIGEIQFYLPDENKDVKISCIEDCVFYKLTPQAHKRLGAEHPDIALKLSAWIIGILSERHTYLAREIKYLI